MIINHFVDDFRPLLHGLPVRVPCLLSFGLDL